VGSAKSRERTAALEPARRAESNVQQGRPGRAASRRQSPPVDLVVDRLDQDNQAGDLLRAKLVEIMRVRSIEDQPRDVFNARCQYAASARIDTALGGVQVGPRDVRRVFLDCQARAHRAHAIGLTIHV
jgi:hypothetical protein